jgi:O-antigen/teichoic acid export membrane protein
MAAAGWQTGIGLLRLVVGFARFVILARLLSIEVFGQFGLASAVVGLSIVLPRFGLTGAFLHRAPETRNEEPAASVLFSLRIGLTLVWALCVTTVVVFVGEDAVRTAVLVLVTTRLLAEPAFVPRLLLVRRLRFARIALQESLATVVGSVAAVLLAFSGAGIWALLAPGLCHAILELVVYYAVTPVWRLRLAADRRITRYLLEFGSRNLLLSIFDTVIEKLPELWTGLVLGTGSLGIYTRAARLTTYPRQISTDPLVSVLQPRFAELKERPSEFASTLKASLVALSVGAGLLAGVLWFAAPWLIENLMGARWLPALAPFRFLAALIVLEPLRRTLTSAIVAQGDPGSAAQIRGVQALGLAPGVAVGAATAGISGVAAAVVVSAALCVALLGRALWRGAPRTTLGATV